MRLGFGQHGSYFAGIGQRMLHAAVEEVDDSTSTEEREYTDGYEIEHDGQHICTIAGWLGKGAMGTVYRAQSRDGREFAVKAVSADKSPAEIAEMQGQLALETSIGFAMGRHPLIASVIGVVVVVPGSKTTAKGLLLLCDKIDCGDLEGAMSSREAVRIQKPDYAGSLWSEPSATTWPLASITLQIFIGFTHVHERGVLHQVRSQPEQIFYSSRLLLEVNLVYSGWCVDQGMAGFLLFRLIHIHWDTLMLNSHLIQVHHSLRTYVHAIACAVVRGVYDLELLVGRVACLPSCNQAFAADSMSLRSDRGPSPRDRPAPSASRPHPDDEPHELYISYSRPL